MKCSDKGLLIGAWAVMIAAGAFSIYKVAQVPRIDPGISRLIGELEKAQNSPIIGCPPERLPKISVIPPIDPRAGFFTPSDEKTRFHPKFTWVAVDPPVRDIQVLPFPAMESAQATLDGATIAWKTVVKEVDHKPWMHPKEAKASGFIVWRESELGQPEKIAELGPAARSYADLSTKPGKTYIYWVTLKGLETDRSNNDGKLMEVTNKAERPVSAKSPADTRLRLVGGDKTHAVLKAESYDRAKKAWIPRTVLTAPGEMVAGTGWLLKGLRFDDFTLVADVTDDDGVVRVLSTRD